MRRNNQNLQYYSALGFYKEGKRLAQQFGKKIGNENLEFVSVSTVCYSFSAELLLKLLIYIVSNETINNEHKLEELFNKLPGELKLKIENNYQQKSKIKNDNLRPIKFSFNSFLGNEEDSRDINNITQLSIMDLLRIHNESFLKWRYLYEIKKDEYYSFEYNFKLMDDFVNSVLDVIKESIVK
jgi:hypothetical protein